MYLTSQTFAAKNHNFSGENLLYSRLNNMTHLGLGPTCASL